MGTSCSTATSATTTTIIARQRLPFFLLPCLLVFQRLSFLAWFLMCLQKLPRRFTPDDTSPMLFLITTYRLRSSLLPCETREHENTLSTILCDLRAANLVILSLPSHSGRLPSFPRQEPFPCMSAIGARAFTLRSKGDFPAHTRLTSPGPSGLTSNPCCVRTKRLFWSPLFLTSACSALQLLRGTRHTRAHVTHTHTHLIRCSFRASTVR